MKLYPWIVSVLCLLTLVSWPAFGQDSNGGIRVLEVDDRPMQPVEVPESVDRILAIVEDQAVTFREYVREFGDTQVRRHRLEQLIDKQLIRQAGRDAGVLLDQARVNQFVDSRLQQIHRDQGPEAFQRYLRQQQQTKAEFRQMLTEQIRDQRLRSEVLVRFFPAILRPDTRAAQQLVRGRLIIVDDKPTADTIYRDVSKKPVMSTWNRLYEKHGQSVPFLGPRGEMDWFRWGSYRPEIEYPFFKHDLFRLSEPFRIGDNWGLAIPTGFRFQTVDGATRESLRAFERYRRRFFSERLTDRLRERYTVRIPRSVQEELTGDSG